MYEVKIINKEGETMIFSQSFENLNIPRLIQFLNQTVRKPRKDKGQKK
jgi:hypothetical protein